jgi:hypothetical protein
MNMLHNTRIVSVLCDICSEISFAAVALYIQNINIKINWLYEAQVYEIRITLTEILNMAKVPYSSGAKYTCLIITDVTVVASKCCVKGHFSACVMCSRTCGAPALGIDLLLESHRHVAKQAHVLLCPLQWPITVMTFDVTVN